MEIWHPNGKKWTKRHFLSFPFEHQTLEEVLLTYLRSVHPLEAVRSDRLFKSFLVFSTDEEEALRGFFGQISRDDVSGQLNLLLVLGRFSQLRREYSRKNPEICPFMYLPEDSPTDPLEQPGVSRRLAFTSDYVMAGGGHPGYFRDWQDRYLESLKN